MITLFNTLDEMERAIREGHEAAEAMVGPEAEQFVPGTFYARIAPEHGAIIYGEILDPVEEERKAGSDEEEVEYQRQLRAEPHMKNYRFTRSYSILCPDGELGDVHVVRMNFFLTGEEFNRAREQRWPTDPRKLFTDVLRIPVPTCTVKG